MYYINKCVLILILNENIFMISYTYVLTFQSNDVGHAGYESSWYSKEVSLQKDLLYIVSRCQHPVTLAVPCMLPTLSLDYFASVSYILNYNIHTSIILSNLIKI